MGKIIVKKSSQENLGVFTTLMELEMFVKLRWLEAGKRRKREDNFLLGLLFLFYLIILFLIFLMVFGRVGIVVVVF